jgi:hypothetical protein
MSGEHRARVKKLLAHIDAQEAEIKKSEQREMEMSDERDKYHEFADLLSWQLARLCGAEIGEHTNLNNPWQNALDASESVPSLQSLQAENAKLRAVVDVCRNLIKTKGRRDARYYIERIVSALAALDKEQEPSIPSHVTSGGCFNCGAPMVMSGPKIAPVMRCAKRCEEQEDGHRRK